MWTKEKENIRKASDTIDWETEQDASDSRPVNITRQARLSNKGTYNITSQLNDNIISKKSKIEGSRIEKTQRRPTRTG